jgi:hypothetical protein
MVPEALDALEPEERHQVYKMLKLRVAVGTDGSIEVKGTLGDGLDVCNLEPSYSLSPFTTSPKGWPSA